MSTSAEAPVGQGADPSAAVPASHAASFVRVEKGHADAEELAALTAILLARAAAGPGGGRKLPTRSIAGWRRLERARGFRAPHSWQG